MEGLSRIGIDIPSVLFYILNFGIIVFILAKFVYKPVIKFLDERSEAIRGNLYESEKLREDFAEQIEQQKLAYEQESKKLREDIERMRSESEAKNRQFLMEAEAERDRMVDEAKRQSEVLKNELENKVEKDLLDRVNLIVNEAVKRKLTGDEVRSHILKSWKEMRNK